MWNLFGQLITIKTRWEILGWYYRKEDLYKVGGSLKRLAAAEMLLWQGEVEVAKALLLSLQILGAHWNTVSVNAVLNLRTAHLNGQFAS